MCMVKEDLKELDRKAKKTMTMYGALHPQSDVNRIYLEAA